MPNPNVGIVKSADFTAKEIYIIATNLEEFQKKSLNSFPSRNMKRIILSMKILHLLFREN